MAYRFITRGTGTYRLASGVLENLISAANVADGVDRGDGVTGTLDTGAGYTYGDEDPSLVLSTAAGHTAASIVIADYELITTGDSRVAAQLQTDKDAVTAGKADILNTRTILTVTGTFDLSLYCLISTVVAADWVVSGHDNRTGGDAGTYPTTADTNAAHLAQDVIDLNAHLDEMIAANTAIKAHYVGVLDGTAVAGGDYATGYAAGQQAANVAAAGVRRIAETSDTVRRI